MTTNTETRHIPGQATPPGANTLTDAELVNQALGSDDYATRRLALIASMKQAQYDQAREMLDVLDEYSVNSPGELRELVTLADKYIAGGEG